MAELRLYTLVQRDRLIYEGVDRKITIFEVLESKEDHEGERSMLVLVSGEIYGTNSEWETFDVTDAIRHWQKSGSSTHQLEVHIESKHETEDTLGKGQLEIDTSAQNKHEPLLVVFSDDQSSEKERKEELDEMIAHEQFPEMDNLDLDGYSNGPGEEALLQMRSNIIYDSTARIRRNAKGNYCKRTRSTSTSRRLAGTLGSSLHLDMKPMNVVVFATTPWQSISPLQSMRLSRPWSTSRIPRRLPKPAVCPPSSSPSPSSI